MTESELYSPQDGFDTVVLTGPRQRRAEFNPIAPNKAKVNL
jgi:hypothetical protein